MKEYKCRKCGTELLKRQKVCHKCGAKRRHIGRWITLGVVGVVLATAIGTASTVWVGHIPEKYDYNPELPKAMTVLSWTDMNSSIVQNAIGRNIKSETEKLEAFEVPDGYALDVYTVQSDGAEIKMYCIQPESLVGEQEVPVVLYTHGGAFYYPLTVSSVSSMEYYADKLQARVFMPDYRSSKYNAFPAPLLDCYNSALYLEENADTLGIDMGKFLIYGDSAGGCLAAGTAQYIRDNGGPELCGQLLVYPVLDNSMKYASMTEYKDAAWSLNSNENMWDIYLADGDQGMLKYAAPMQSDDFSELPRAYVEPAEMDILRDEAVAYANAMQAEGVEAEVNITDRTYHGFDADQSNSYVKSVLEKRVEVMKDMLGE